MLTGIAFFYCEEAGLTSLNLLLDLERGQAGVLQFGSVRKVGGLWMDRRIYQCKSVSLSVGVALWE